MNRSRSTTCMFFLIFLLAGCTERQPGTLEGTVSPPAPGIRVTANQEGRQIAAAEAGAQDGSFRLPLPAGAYDISITAPSSPFPLRFSGIVIRAGEATVLAPLALGPVKGSASIRGTVYAAGGQARVVLLADGNERASVAATSGGAYAFEELPAGTYLIRVQATGYAPESMSAVLQDGQRASIDVRMLYRTSIDGVDWDKGTLRVRGLGSPPKQAPTPTIRREMAKRAAITDAERNILRALQMVQLGPSEKLAASFGEQAFTERLQGYLQGYRIVAERDLDGGRMEVEIELPLTGPGGLLSSLQQR